MESIDILVVDDEPKIFKTITRSLKKYTYKLMYAQSGSDALELMSENRFKVVISDIKMMKMNGIEFLDKVHELNRDITRIALSGHPDVEFILSLVNQRGIDRYLTKPFETADLILAIDKCIELYDLRHQSKKQPHLS